MKKKHTRKSNVKATNNRPASAQRRPAASSKKKATPTAPAPSGLEFERSQLEIGRLLHDESEADDDGFIAGAGFDRYGGFPGDGLS